MKLRKKISLSRISSKFLETMHRDGLAIVESKSGSIIERLSKRLKKVFNRFDLKITINFNLVKSNFLDVELDLRNDIYAPYRKPNFQATYVNVQSNHPRYVDNHVPKFII